MEVTLKALIVGCLLLGVLSQNEGPKVTDFGQGSYSCEHARLAWNSHIYFIEQEQNTPIDYPLAMNGMSLTKTSGFNTLTMKIQYLQNYPQITPACRYLQWDSQNITLDKSTPPNFRPIQKVPTISPQFRSASSKDKLEFTCIPNMGETRVRWIVHDDSKLMKLDDPSQFTVTDIVVGQGKHASRLEILKTSGDAMFVFCSSINSRVMIETLYSDMALVYVSDSNPFKKYWWLILLGVVLVLGIIAGITFCVYKCRAGNRRQYM